MPGIDLTAGIIFTCITDIPKYTVVVSPWGSRYQEDPDPVHQGMVTRSCIAHAACKSLAILAKFALALHNPHEAVKIKDSNSFSLRSDRQNQQVVGNFV